MPQDHMAEVWNALLNGRQLNPNENPVMYCKEVLIVLEVFKLFVLIQIDLLMSII